MCYLTGLTGARCSVLYISDLTQTSMVVSKGVRGSTPLPSRVCGFHWVTRITLASRDGMQRLWEIVDFCWNLMDSAFCIIVL